MITPKLSGIQVAILAGGYGTRLKEVTRATPKPMVQVLGKPFLEYILKWVYKSGLTRIVLMVGHLGHVIEDYFGNGRKWGMDIRYSHESPPLGTAGALKKAEELLEEDFLLINGDTFLPIEYRAFAKQFRRGRSLALVAAYDNSEYVAPNNLSFSSDCVVTRYGTNFSSAPLTHVDAGLYGFRKEIIRRLPSDKIMCLSKEIYPQLISKQELMAYPISQRYYDIGTLERLGIFKKQIPVILKSAP